MPHISIEYNALDYIDKLIESFATSFNIVLKKFTQDNNQPVRKVSLINVSREEILKNFRNNTDPTTIEKVYTMQILYRLGFSWSITTWDYVGRFVKMLKGLGFFEI